jgi:hypothetical protein
VDVVDFARSMYKLLRERELDLTQALAAGSVQSWDQYKMTVGEIRGLSFAREEMKALLEKTADDAEDLISS